MYIDHIYNKHILRDHIRLILGTDHLKLQAAAKEIETLADTEDFGEMCIKCRELSETLREHAETLTYLEGQISILKETRFLKKGE